MLELLLWNVDLVPVEYWVYFCMVLYDVLFLGMLDLLHLQTYYRSGMVNSKSFVSTYFLFNE